MRILIGCQWEVQDCHSGKAQYELRIHRNKQGSLFNPNTENYPSFLVPSPSSGKEGLNNLSVAAQPVTAELRTSSQSQNAEFILICTTLYFCEHRKITVKRDTEHQEQWPEFLTLRNLGNEYKLSSSFRDCGGSNTLRYHSLSTHWFSWIEVGLQGLSLYPELFL